MGLRDKIQSKVGAAFDKALADAVGPFVLTEIITGAYDPATGTTTTEDVHHDGRGVFGGFRQDEIDGQHIVATDIKLTVLQSELTDKDGNPSVPKVGFSIRKGAGNSWFFYFFKFSGYPEHRVINVEQDPAGSCWFVQLRKA